MIIRISRVIRGGDEGITLAELLVGMTLTALALAMIGGFFSNIMRSVGAGRTARVGTSIAVHAANELSRVIRTASSNPVANATPTPAIVDGTSTTLTVISYVDTDSSTPAPTRVSFSVNAAGNLIETRTAAVQASGYWVFTGTVTQRTIPGPISSTAAIFAYMDGTGAAVVPGATGLTAAQAAAITAVTITVTASNRNTDPVQITTTAVMANLTLS